MDVTETWSRLMSICGGVGEGRERREERGWGRMGWEKGGAGLKNDE